MKKNSPNEKVKIPLSADEVQSIILKVIENEDISKLDNLRQRHPNIQFDCLLRGYIGEYAIEKWVNSFGIFFENSNIIEEEDNIDIDFLYKGKNLELKTSLVPDADVSVDTAILKRDIKLIKRGNTPIENLKGDIHLQIYYDQKRKAKDDWLKNQKIDLNSRDIRYLYDQIGAKAYLNRTYFVGWIDKKSIIQKINQLPNNQQYWSFKGSKREFWSCKIVDSFRPIELIDYLRNI